MTPMSQMHFILILLPHFFVHNSAGCMVKMLRQVGNLVMKQSSCLCEDEIQLSLPWWVLFAIFDICGIERALNVVSMLG